ncbi:hypothetical protein HYDPIDRAFT_111123 [Hydnomerulius pinastri MD-312]|uniref:Uncharacterized protein n=1 Tax=Hydnomerulius pinastri MD-312 TaxID=994086 RepID=A0A0C9WGD1_9AGAM|nr:hypothetical protein HYDPIDRAFT_111123 [Hydnomerulius pinastri MD-312]
MAVPSFKRKHRLSDGHALPLTSSRTPSPPPMSSYGLTRRGLRLIVLAILTAASVLAYLRWHDVWQRFLGHRLPPLYEKVRQNEQRLPHYNEYQHKTVKYFFAANHAHSSGWGNVMQDFVMMGLLAHATNRSFVFDDYIWNPDGSRFSDYNGKLIPSRIPLSALLSGPMVGSPMPAGDYTPRSVSKEFFHKACPNPTVLQVSDVNTDEMRFNDDVPASYVFEKWVEKINSVDDPCLMLDPSSNQIFEIWIFGNKNRMLTIWPYVANSPVATHWGWSPFIHDAYKKNRHLFQPTPPTGIFGGFFDSNIDEDMTAPIPGLLALHVRRGDFKDHCVHLAKWSADWNAFNSFPEFHDKFDRPTDGGWGETSDKNMDHYIQRCYPSIEQIVEKVRQVRMEATEHLRYLYIMTNGPVPWVEELKAALAQDMIWEQVGSSRDLKVTWEQKFIAQALDMYVAQRAQVLIGNGWSSLTSNVVMLRMARGFHPDTNRFW